MRRQVTLADLLADDTGNIRPEVAGLLMEERSPRRVPRGRMRIPPWFIVGLVILSILKALFSGSEKPMGGIKISPPVPLSCEAVATDRSKFAAVEPKLTQADFVQDPCSLGKGRVFGYRVNIRKQPTLDGLIIGQTNQGKLFDVLSFNNGWYQIRLDDGRIGHIFGAYLLPMDFDVAPYRVGVTRDNTKVLLTECRHQEWYRIISPNGEDGYIRKRHVSIVR